MGGSVTTKQKSAPAPEAMQYYRDMLERAKGVGQLAYTPYGGQRVAEFTPYQQMAMQNVQGLQGAGMGTLQEAIEAGRRGTAPITTADIQRYQDPYQQMVIDAMSAKMRQQEAEDISKLQGTSISQGAFGGDRAKLAQAQLMRSQEQERNAQISNLMSKGYSQSVAAAQADREAALRGSQDLSALATQQYTQPMSWVRDLYGMGAAQQALEQQKLNVPYQTYLEQRAFPYEQLQYLASIGTGVGSQMGGTSSTTQPGPNPFSQIFGAGTALGSAWLMGGAPNIFPSDERLKENIEDVGTTHDGQTIYKYNFKGDPKTHIGLLAQEVEQTHPEAVGEMAGFKMVNYDLATKDAAHKADGGGLTKTAMFHEGFIPGLNPVRGSGAPRPPSPQSQKENTSESMIDSALSLASKIKKSQDPTNPASWQTTTTLSPENPASWNTTVSQPSFLSNIGSYFGYAHGGGINVPRYYNGGGTDEDALLSADPRILEAFKSLGPDRTVKYPQSGPIPEPPTAKEVVEALVDPRLAQAYKAYGSGAKKEPVVPISTASPPVLTTEAVKQQTLPETTAKEQKLPEITVPTQDVMEVGIGDALNQGEKAPSAGISEPFTKSGETGGLFGTGFDLSPEAKMSLLAAGLGMMAGQSPFFLSNVGTGGLSGVKTYSDLMKAKQEKELKEKELAAKAGQRDMVGTDYVTSDGRMVQRDRNTGQLYDGKMNILSDDEIDKLRQKKTMPTKVENDLRNAGELLINTENLTNSYQPGYGGYIAEYAGDLNNWIATRLGGSEKDKERAAWWQEYAKQAGVIRKSLYGVAFTKSEQALWNKSDINPGMTDDAIQRNLKIQKDIAERAVRRLARSQVKKGYDPDLVAENLGLDITDMLEGGPKESVSEEESPKTTETTTSSSIEQAKKQLQPGQKIEQKSNGYWLIDPPNEPKFLGK